MDFELDFSSENSTMTSFLELEQEIREAPPLSEPLVRPSPSLSSPDTSRLSSPA